MRQLILLLGLCLLWAWPAQAETIFFDTDFESGSSVCDWPANGWGDFGQAPCSGSMTISTTKALTGTHSLRLVYTTMDNTQCVTACTSIYRSASTVIPFPAGTHRSIRFAINVDSNFQISPNNTKLIRMHEGTVYPRPWLSLNSGTYRVFFEGPYDYAGNVQGFDTGVAPNRGNWDQIEFEWQLNTCGQSNGYFNMWVNGVLRTSSFNRAWIGAGSNPSGLASSCAYQIRGIQVYRQNGIGNLYYDRIAVGDTRVGLVGAAPSADTTAPSPPTGVTVN